MATTVKAYAMDETTLLCDLTSAALGRSLNNPVDLPNGEPIDPGVTWARTIGDVYYSRPRPATDVVGVQVKQRGATVAEMLSRWNDVETALWDDAHADMILEVNIDGFTRRWFTRWPSITPAPFTEGSRVALRHIYQVQFRVQPNPSVTITA
jgi:hypothetical protein